MTLRRLIQETVVVVEIFRQGFTKVTGGNMHGLALLDLASSINGTDTGKIMLKSPSFMGNKYLCCWLW